MKLSMDMMSLLASQRRKLTRWKSIFICDFNFLYSVGCIGQGFLAEEEYPRLDIPNSLFEQLYANAILCFRKMLDVLTLISLFLALNMPMERSPRGNVVFDSTMDLRNRDTRLNQDCALLSVEAKSDTTSPNKHICVTLSAAPR